MKERAECNVIGFQFSYPSFRQAGNHCSMPLFFNADALPDPTNEYVAWVDVMGTRASMSNSMKITANFIFKLHIAAMQAPHAGIRIYPVMDGFYASCPSKAEILDFLRSVFSEVAATFEAETEPRFRFLIRGALAYGRVVHGESLPAATSHTLAGVPAYRDQILLGMPMVQAHLAEEGAPPFGIQVHESARTFAPAGAEPLHDTWWTWDNAATHAVWVALLPALNEYFAWCEERFVRINYESDRIAAHRAMARQYFV